MKSMKCLLVALLLGTSVLFAQKGDMRWLTTQRFAGELTSKEKERSIPFINHGCRSLDAYVYCSSRLDVTLTSPNGLNVIKGVIEPYPGHEGRTIICVPKEENEEQPPSLGTWTLKLSRRPGKVIKEYYEIALNFVDSRFDYNLKVEPSDGWSLNIGDTVTLRLNVWELLDVDTGKTRGVPGAKITATYIKPRSGKKDHRQPMSLAFSETGLVEGEYLSTLVVDQAGEWPFTFVVSGGAPDVGPFSILHTRYLTVKKGNHVKSPAGLTSRSSRTPPALSSAPSQYSANSAPLIVSAQAWPLSFFR